ncbi:hypothetical protein VWH05_05875 [Escherichia coli O157]|nr:hypothetical protein [Escherichia coli O157]
MLPFGRMFDYGNIKPVPEPEEFDEVLQQQYYNTLYLHKPTNTLYGYGLNSNKQLSLLIVPTEFMVLSTDCKKYWTGVFGTLMVSLSNKIYYCGSRIAFPQATTASNTDGWKYVTEYFDALGVVGDDIKSVYIGASTRVLLNDGRVMCCGNNAYAECGTGVTGAINTLQFVPQFGTDVKSMYCSTYGTHYINSRNESYFVGENTNGTSGTGTANDSIVAAHTLTARNVKHISTNYNTTWWFFENGDIYWCGLNNMGQAGNNSVTSGYTLLAVKNTVLSGTIDLPTLKSPSSLSTGYVGAPIASYSSRIRNGGINDLGQLGLGTITPFERSWIDMNISIIGTYDDVLTISKDIRSSMILTKDYKLYACGGYNSNGQSLPDGSYVTSTLKLMANMPWY